MISNLRDAKAWLRVELDFPEDDILIQGLLDAAESFIFNSTGIRYDDKNPLAVLLQRVLVCEWYQHREAAGKANELEIKPTIRSILSQLKYAGLAPESGDDG